MPMKGRDASTYREVDRWSEGVGWIAYPDEMMQRTSHAVIGDDGNLWVIDPVDAPGVDELLSTFGSANTEIAGVVVGLDRHTRDAAALASRHDVPIYVPTWMSGVADEVDNSVERFRNELGDSGYEAFEILNRGLPPWQEVGLFHRENGTLIIPEAVGTVSYFCAPGERLGIHPMLRPFPPRQALSRFEPKRILVGHGTGIMSNAARSLAAAVDNSRSNLPSAYSRAFKQLIS
ncbi:hypothetical protein [Haloquadratum walsbyi]|uniref:Beta-lactamase domain protein n=1 Tax=Haloquadratum walsbyi (strain DSM 16854 / JCM 12705 / C23) TaxID=768065 RepID=G0LLN2_HALWC|nr:hypothetical protein [Haloquadratum walsbyi]CCC40838.1 beta-lactamase domain protein [Haloquadratum walsbyi C23]